MNRQFRWINDYLAETARLLDQLDRAAIDQAAELLLACYQRRGRVWTLGNGGSASTRNISPAIWPSSSFRRERALSIRAV